MLTIEDLGILREVEETDAGVVMVTITPTYSGCPAMDAIRDDIVAAFAEAGRDDVRVDFTLSPAWTTDWMSDGRQAQARGLRHRATATDDHATESCALTLSLRCPQCGSPDTRELSRFGSTACKSLWVCNACREPFDHFKSI